MVGGLVNGFHVCRWLDVRLPIFLTYFCIGLHVDASNAVVLCVCVVKLAIWDIVVQVSKVCKLSFLLHLRPVTDKPCSLLWVFCLSGQSTALIIHNRFSRILSYNLIHSHLLFFWYLLGGNFLICILTVSFAYHVQIAHDWIAWFLIMILNCSCCN